MNEPSVFNKPELTLPRDSTHFVSVIMIIVLTTLHRGVYGSLFVCLGRMEENIARFTIYTACITIERRMRGC